MGILQSCEGHDANMRVSLDNNLFRTMNQSNYSTQDYFYKHSKLNLFGDIFYKKVQTKTQFVLQINFINRASEVIHHPIKIYQNSTEFLNEKGSKIKIINCMDDPNWLDQKLYIIKMQNKPNEMLLKLIPFNRYEEERFKKGIYEVAMLHKNMREQNNRYSFSYQDAFVIESGIDKDSNDKCLAIIGDAVSCSLHEIITFRKMEQIPWTEHQFQSLCFQLIKGVHQIHSNKIAHRQIRPHNIFYSPLKKGFVIGAFHNAISLDSNFKNVGFNLSGVPYYMPKYLVNIGKRQQFSEYYNYDPYNLDIYSLGLTMMNSLFLDQFMPPQILSQSLKKYDKQYNFLKLIRSMLLDNPPILKEVLDTLSQGDKTIDERSHIQSLRYKAKPQDEEFVLRKKMIANGYYEMFMYDQWVDQINQVVNYYEMNKNNMQLGDVYKQIADIYAEHHQQEMMIQYYAKASHVFLTISQDCLEEKKNQQAIKYLEKGIECNRKGFQGQPNLDLAQLLNKLAMVHHTKAQYEIARAFQQESLEIIGAVNGIASTEYAEMLVDSAKIESEFQEFKQAENMLKAGIKIIERKDQTAQNMRVKGKLLQSLGNNYRMKAIEKRQKCQSYRKKAEQCLLDALEITERVEGSIHPQVGSILLSLGNIYFDKRQFDKAKKSYEKSLIVKQHTLKGRNNLEVGECLTYLANSQKFLKEYDKSIRHYDEAIQVFRVAYGNDHNENTAVAIGNLGLVYKELGRGKEEKEYLSLAKSILKDLYGQECPDYQYFDRQMSK